MERRVCTQGRMQMQAGGHEEEEEDDNDNETDMPSRPLVPSAVPPHVVVVNDNTVTRMTLGMYF